MPWTQLICSPWGCTNQGYSTLGTMASYYEHTSGVSTHRDYQGKGSGRERNLSVMGRDEEADQSYRVHRIACLSPNYQQGAHLLGKSTQPTSLSRDCNRSFHNGNRTTFGGSGPPTFVGNTIVNGQLSFAEITQTTLLGQNGFYTEWSRSTFVVRFKWKCPP